MQSHSEALGGVRTSTYEFQGHTVQPGTLSPVLLILLCMYIVYRIVWGVCCVPNVIEFACGHTGTEQGLCVCVHSCALFIRRGHKERDWGRIHGPSTPKLETNYSRGHLRAG